MWEKEEPPGEAARQSVNLAEFRAALVVVCARLTSIDARLKQLCDLAGADAAVVRAIVAQQVGR